MWRLAPIAIFLGAFVLAMSPQVEAHTRPITISQRTAFRTTAPQAGRCGKLFGHGFQRLRRGARSEVTVFVQTLGGVKCPPTYAGGPPHCVEQCYAGGPVCTCCDHGPPIRRHTPAHFIYATLIRCGLIECYPYHPHGPWPSPQHAGY
jgi:hypothetical protein